MVALLGVIIMAIVFPIYYYQMFHFNTKYTKLMSQVNKALSNTGIISTYVDNCPSNIVIDGDPINNWCNTVIDNI